MIARAGLIINRSKQAAIEAAGRVIAFLTERDIDVLVDEAAASLIGRDDIAATDIELAASNLLITLGGDGTILTAARIAAQHGIPVLGVHMGQFGFIAETDPAHLFQDLENTLDLKVKIEERMMVQGVVLRDGNEVWTASGLNDVVISKAATARMLRLETAFGTDQVFDYLADGVVAATPTGSTAYALSAGGPLVAPTMQALLIVPICAHTLAARPLLVPSTERIAVTVRTDGGEVLFSADGTQTFALESGDCVQISKAPCALHLVTTGRTDFYQKVRKRLLWAERINP